MSHWLEEIERMESRKNRSASDSARIQDKKFRIQQNYQKNKIPYDSFIERLNKLVERVNDLPLEHREVFGKLTAKSRISKLDNHLNYFSSSRKIHKVEFRSIINPLKNIHYKHIRVIFINVAKIMDKVEVEILEVFQEKKVHDGKLISEEDKNKHNPGKPRSDKNKFHEIYYYDINNLSDELGLKIIDWLTFHVNLEELPIVKDGELRFKDKE